LLTFSFWRENFHWVTQADDASLQDECIRADQIDSAHLMLLAEGHCLKDQALAVCHLADTAALGVSATSLATLVQLVAGRMGSTLVPEMALASLVDSNPALRRLPLAEPGPHREIAFVVRPTYPGLRNIETLKQLFARELQRAAAQT
jgi:LysR family hydrogen peroxide-inducible transcriptional activator